ncbi:hypothetical protein HMN09_01090400 [Mycena chlorophos]|uniref:Uncharacterized protein n=1 Tax=Mycena chlorophos TaxID=658473 RepID=A0A8H6SCH7_MYCCL|nr:hypothetical protein HMN09_01090400 [Mycena chlorophos]
MEGRATNVSHVPSALQCLRRAQSDILETEPGPSATASPAAKLLTPSVVGEDGCQCVVSSGGAFAAAFQLRWNGVEAAREEEMSRRRDEASTGDECERQPQQTVAISAERSRSHAEVAAPHTAPTLRLPSRTSTRALIVERLVTLVPSTPKDLVLTGTGALLPAPSLEEARRMASVGRLLRFVTQLRRRPYLADTSPPSNRRSMLLRHASGLERSTIP